MQVQLPDGKPLELPDGATGADAAAAIGAGLARAALAIRGDDGELKDLISELTDEEREVSYRRRVLHGKIDILRAELVNRLKVKREEGDSALTGADVEQLTDILLGKVPSPEDEV